MKIKELPRFTFGMGDRFGLQGQAQLKAVMDAVEEGYPVAPVWNKSKREHTLIGSEPASLRTEADAAVLALEYKGPYFVDADHITIHTVADFLSTSDFFTLDVAEDLGRPPTDLNKKADYEATLMALGEVSLDGLEAPLLYNAQQAAALVNTYGGAIEAAKALYEVIAKARPQSPFAVEVSMDETAQPQGPLELLGILCLLAKEGVPVQTIAPKFTGRFNKGVDYVGNLAAFEAEFEADLRALKYAVKNFGLPETLKLSVHSGSDKFSLYPVIQRLVAKHKAGLHLKTAGTTWLEEVIGLAEAGGDGLEFVQALYVEALKSIDTLTAPYATVIDLNPGELPDIKTTQRWISHDWVSALAHDPKNPVFNSSMRQLLHVAFKLAAKPGSGYMDLLDKYAAIVNRRVHHNLLRKHIVHVFPKKS